MSIARPSRWDYAAVAVAALQSAAGLYVLRFGPEGAIPMHFNVHGEVDRWGDRAEAAAVILACAVITLAVHLTVSFTAARATLDRNGRRVLSTARIIGLAAPPIASLPLVYLGGGLAQDLPPQTAILVAFMGAWILVSLTGMSLGKTTPNPWLGVRVYWTYKSRLAWDKSNRLLGRVYFFGGLAGLVLTPLLDLHGRIALLVAVLVGGAAASLYEAWRTWRSDPERTA